MDNKLQELTDRLYDEGIARGRKDAEQIIENARKEAERIEAEERAKLQEIVSNAQKEVDNFRNNVVSDLNMAINQTLEATKKDVENLLVSLVVEPEVNKVMSSSEFIKDAIMTVVEKFSVNEAPQELSVILPEKLKSELEPMLKKAFAEKIGKGIEANFSKKVNGGFKIGPKDGSYYISFTDETFKELFKEYLRPATRKLLSL